MTFFPVIISGGAGSRLWPLSREAHPKPFLPLPDGGTLIGKTYARAASLPNVNEIVTVTNREFLFLTRDAYEEACAPECRNTFLLEPEGRDTAAAVALAAVHVANEHGESATLIILPADHLIEDETAFEEAVLKARHLAEVEDIVAFGVKPDRPEMGFGYIEADGHRVLRFIEKPDRALAESFVASGKHYWNSGMLVSSAGRLINAMNEHCPQVLEGARRALKAAKRGSSGESETLEIDRVAFSRLPATSIDYAVMEKMASVGFVPLSCGWSDIGSWAALAELVSPDECGNRITGEVVLEDSQDCFVHAADRIAALVGVDNLLVIDTPDALLVAHRDQAQKVKDVYTKLKLEDHEAAKLHRTAHRPWGTYTVLEEGNRFKIKRIEVKPGARLSLQAHHHRAEHWIVVSGTAKVVNGDQEILLSTNQSTYIPCGHKHRMENPGILPLVLIEVQSGEYLGEDDIVRFEDVYGRK